MYIVNGICYASTPDSSMRIVGVKPLQGGMLLVDFLSGEQRLFDTTMLEGPAFAPLANPDVFAAPVVEHGFVSWLDGAIDVAPEYVYENSVPYEGAFDVLQAG